MNDTLVLMQIFQRLCDLDNDVPTEFFTEVGKADDLVEELAPGAELKDDVVVLAGFGESDEGDDVGMVKLSHDLNFFENVGALEKS